ILNCTRTCPKGLNPGKAIAEIKKKVIERPVECRVETRNVRFADRIAPATISEHSNLPTATYVSPLDRQSYQRGVLECCGGWARRLADCGSRGTKGLRRRRSDIGVAN